MNTEIAIDNNGNKNGIWNMIIITGKNIFTSHEWKHCRKSKSQANYLKGKNTRRMSWQAWQGVKVQHIS
ncbi:MAG: hypothetical protein ACOYMF_01525 [Bacteroidales bacterium]